MKKIVWTLAVDNYFPELCSISLPNHQRYADRIGAEFRVITDRKYPEWHPTYEKVQIFEGGAGAAFNVHIDADLLVSPWMPDTTTGPMNELRWYSIYDPALYFAPDRFFGRDGRRIGICSAFLAVPALCHDLWEPFDLPYEEALKGINRPHGIDDYCFSQNFAKYGLKGNFADESAENIVHLSVGGKEPERWTTDVLERARAVADNWR